MENGTFIYITQFFLLIFFSLLTFSWIKTKTKLKRIRNKQTLQQKKEEEYEKALEISIKTRIIATVT